MSSWKFVGEWGGVEVVRFNGREDVQVVMVDIIVNIIVLF